MPKALKNLLPPRPTGTSKKSKGVNAPVNPFIINENNARNKKFKGEDAPINPFIIYENGDKNKESNKGEDAPINPFIIYENAGRNKEFKGEDAPINPFIIYENGGKTKESDKGEDAPINPFIIYENGGRNKESKGEDAPINPFIIYEKQSKGNKNSVGRRHDKAAMNETIYFFQEDLRPGKMLNLPLLAKTRDFTPFLSHQLAHSIPFSSDKLPEILKHLSFGSDSMQADAMKQTIKGCERQVMRGEQMFCATSFDSFIDLSVSKLGKSIQLLANELGKETNNPMFRIGRGIQNMGEEELVCHKMRYPYAVFLCHSIEGTVVYKVPLVGVRGTKATALAICHKDTSAWSPNHPAFLILNVKPGTVPICHFVVRDTLVWVRK